jgi:hypothetical protein
MTKLKLLSAGLIAAAVLTTPAMARQGHVTSRQLAANAYVGDAYASDAYASAAPNARYVDGRFCVPAPRVGAFATQPWDNGNAPCEPASGY